jgi:hypothetical protein
MRWLLILLLSCHAAESKTPTAVVDPPKPAPVVAEPVEREVGPGHFTMVIDFSVLRAHPASQQLAALIPLLPLWKQSLSGSKLDVMRDCDWLSIEGDDVHDATRDVVLVHYSGSDADVEAAIGALAGPAKSDLGEPTVRAWQVYQHGERVFLRPSNDHIVAIMPLDKAKEWAHTLAGSVVRAPHNNRAVDISATNPKTLVSIMPAAFVQERIVVTAQGNGALLHLEGDCADEASAAPAAIELERGVRERNSLAVKLATGGAFSHFKASAKGPMVVADIPFSPEQVDAVLKMTAIAEGARVPNP